MRPFLVDDHTFNKVRVIDCATDFLLHIDVTNIHLTIGIGNECDSFYKDLTKLLFRYLSIFSGECCLCDLFEDIRIVWLYCNGKTF